MPKDLELVIGCLNHVAFVTPFSQDYLNRIRNLFSRGNHLKQIKLATEVINDLRLLLNFIYKAKKVISLNLVVKYEP